MLDQFPIALIVGVILGFLSGLGIGGGSLLMLWLILVLQIDPLRARSINMLFFLPSALVSCALRIRQGRLKLRPLLPAMVAGALAAGLFFWIGTRINITILEKLFGMLLLAAGLRELLWHSKKKKHDTN